MAHALGVVSRETTEWFGRKGSPEVWWGRLLPVGYSDMCAVGTKSRRHWITDGQWRCGHVACAGERKGAADWAGCG